VAFVFINASNIWPGFQKNKFMPHFDSYRVSFPNARLTRSKTGVLEVALHTNGDTLVCAASSMKNVTLGLALEGISAADVARKK
jgi:hypothetical protein